MIAHSTMGQAFHSRRHRGIAAVLFALALGGCSVAPEPIPPAAIKSMVTADLARLYHRQEPIDAPLTIHGAMARVLKYNLDNRLKLMDEAMALRQVDVANVSMLPRIAANAGYVSRSNAAASSSRSVTTGRQSLETSTSQDQDRTVADLSVTWNILDFGISYISAQQNADRALIARERRRKVIQNLLQDTRLVFWRAVAAERQQGRIAPLLARIDAASRKSQAIGQQQLASPIEAFTYQRSLLRTHQRLLELQRELQVAQAQLAALMDMPPATQLHLLAPAPEERRMPELALDPLSIEDIALVQRPELVEEAYQARIGGNETRKMLLRMLSGIELSAGLNFDSNSYLLYHRWADYGTRVVWNLFNVLTGPANIALAQSQEAMIETRRLALAMAVVAQARVSWLRYQQALEDLRVARELDALERRISQEVRNLVTAERRGELDAIQAEFDALVADIGSDLAYAETQNAAGNILVTMGFDPLPELLAGDDVATVAEALRKREADWFAGRLPPLSDGPAIPSAEERR